MTRRFCKISHNNVEYIEWNCGDFVVKQKKNNHGLLLEKMYLYTKNGGAGDYYDTTAFAVFSQRYLLEQYLNIELESGF